MKRQEMLSRIRSVLDKNDACQEDVAILEKSMRDKCDLAPNSCSSRAPTSTDTLLIHFLTGAKKNDIDLIEVEDRKLIPSRLKKYFSEISRLQSSVCCFEREVLDLPWGSEEFVIENDLMSSGQTIGISAAWGGIAETGTLLLLSSPSNPTSLSFLSEVHIIILKASQIFNTLEDAFAHLLTAHEMRRWPHAINLISGASRTGDIGGNIVHGAHGPIKLAVVMLTKE